MAKHHAKSQDSTRVTIRFRDEAVAQEFLRQAAEAEMRPSPFAAALIERALTQTDADEFEQATLRCDIQDLRETLRELPREMAENATDNDDILSELTLLRRELAELRESRVSPPASQDDLQKILRGLKQLRSEMKVLAALPHVFVKLREDVATAVRPILVRACGLSPGEAETWIRHNVLEESSC